jgi:hypothetical protein
LQEAGFIFATVAFGSRGEETRIDWTLLFDTAKME